MTAHYRNRRHLRRGGILAAAMLFFVMVTVAGTCILSMSTIQRIKTVRNGIDVRLLIAAEGGIESVRGRFTLIKGVQDDWSWVSDTTWTSVGTVVVNGQDVVVTALRNPSNSVPRARVRASATASGRTRVVEYTIRVASFSDYSVFAAGGTFGANYKLVGNYYANGSLDVPYTGIRLYGRTELTGTVYGTYSSPTDPEYPFVNQAPITVSPIPFPTDLTEWDYMKTVAETTGYVYGENTMQIIFNGTTFTRWYVRRKTSTAGNGTIPSSAGSVDNTSSSWVDPTNGTIDYSNNSSTNPRLVNGDYEWVSETVNIPDEGVIYVQSGPASGVTGGPLTGSPYFNDSVSGGSATNGFTQQYGSNSISGSDSNIFYNQGGYGVSAGYSPVLLISGVIDDSRVTLVCDHRIIIKDCISYQGLLDNPNLRRFFNDGSSGKQHDDAMNMKEMLGVMSKTEIHPTPTWWNPLPDASRVQGDLSGETIPGHDWSDIKSSSAGGGDYSLDGVFLAINQTAPARNYGYTSGYGPLGEMWLCGGLICQGSYGGGFGNTFYRRNYDWDYRMNITMPPYFLRAYNTTARFVPGTWRTWSS
ncbi:MAG: hypothetical protein KDB90_00740 [Planctomycetes bacterium]|nr:hypothetical protein [Planctomycetota bacterium]